MKAFCRAEEPVESNDGEEDGVVFCDPEFGVAGVEGIRQFAEDGGVDRVGSAGWVVFLGHGFDKSSEYGMELVGSSAESRILVTQVGEPLPHCL